ncbi:cyclase family protein [Gangjinia marincola]|uniref:Cyclase family protein n=1 Tax=Gangjinia marincola TaxID=578463 RepID=A0ABP3XVR0_9FLAO
MIAEITYKNRKITIDLNKPVDLSIPLRDGAKNPLVWYQNPPKMTPVRQDEDTYLVEQGAAVNFRDIYFNPHAHGTHTECYGHIAEEIYSVNKALNTSFFMAKVVSLVPETHGDDLVFSKKQLVRNLRPGETQALIVRTLPNTSKKKTRDYNHTNWPYFLEEAARYLRESGISHLLVDLPSVDKEHDDGHLLAHKAFWNYPNTPRRSATITELIYVPNKVKDGFYMLNLQIAPFENDATPSKPIIFELDKVIVQS